MWTLKHAPKKTGDIIGNKVAVARFISWLKKWKKGKAALIYGPPGTGKTMVVHLAAKEMDCEVVEMNASDFRNEERINGVLGQAAAQASLFSKGKLLLVDEVDGISGSRDRGGMRAVMDLIDKSSYPVVLTANFVLDAAPRDVESCVSKFRPAKSPPSKFEIFKFIESVCRSMGIDVNPKMIWAVTYANYDKIAKNEREIASALRAVAGGGGGWWSWNPKLLPLRSRCELIYFGPLPVAETTKILDHISKKESVAVGSKTLESIAIKSGGDARAAVISLQALSSAKKIEEKDVESLGHKDRTLRMSDALRIIFKTRDAKTAASALDEVDEDPRDILLWLDENIAREYEQIDDISGAYDALSKADVFAGRIMRRQDWGLLLFQFDMMGPGVALAKKEKYAKKAEYADPLSTFSHRLKKQRELRKAVSAKLGKHCHISSREAAAEYLFLIKALLRHGSKLAETLDLDEEEVHYVTGAENGKRHVHGKKAAAG